MGKYFKKERKIKPSSINKFHSLGIYYCKNEEYKKAIEFFKKVLIIDPDHADSKNKIELLIKKPKEKENHLNGENSLGSNNKKKQGGMIFENISKNKKIVRKQRKLSDDKIEYYKEIFKLYKEYGTLEKVGRKVGLTRERIRQILERGNRYGLFEYPIKKDLISYPFLINYFTNKEELLNELSDCLKKDEMLLALSTDIVNFNRLLSHFNLNIKDIQIYSKKKTLKMQYDEYVKNIEYHPTTTEMREGKEARNIWAKITRYWGSMENFRQEFGYPFIKQGNPRLKEDIREWQQQRSVLAILRKKSYMEIVLKSLSERGPLNKKYLARECDISEQDCLNILNSMIKREEIIRLKCGAKTTYMIKE